MLHLMIAGRLHWKAADAKLAGKRFGPIPAIEDNLLFLYGEVIVFSAIKLWRLYEDRKSASIES